MTGLVENYAAQVGWVIARNTVIVEGISDVAFLSHAATLHANVVRRPIFDDDFAIVAAGRGDDGGVDGINRRLNTMRQLSEVDPDIRGASRHRFVGLFDNDAAGRSAFAVASSFDRRVEPYVDIFLLHPILPPPMNGVLDRRMEVAKLNLPYARLDWEIEDLCSERLLLNFETLNPSYVLNRETKNGKVHREFIKSAKPELKRHFLNNATIEDAQGFLALLKNLRHHLGLTHEFIALTPEV